MRPQSSLLKFSWGQMLSCVDRNLLHATKHGTKQPWWSMLIMSHSKIDTIDRYVELTNDTDGKRQHMIYHTTMVSVTTLSAKWLTDPVSGKDIDTVQTIQTQKWEWDAAVAYTMQYSQGCQRCESENIKMAVLPIKRHGLEELTDWIQLTATSGHKMQLPGVYPLNEVFICMSTIDCTASMYSEDTPATPAVRNQIWYSLKLHIQGVANWKPSNLKLWMWLWTVRISTRVHTNIVMLSCTKSADFRLPCTRNTHKWDAHYIIYVIVTSEVMASLSFTWAL